MKQIMFTIVLALAACRHQAQQTPDVLQLKSMSDLATVEYTVTKIIKASDDKTWYKVGDRKILMSCEAHIKAGIDLSLLDEGDVWQQGKAIKVRLPEPKIISLSMPPESIRTAYEETGLLREKFTLTDRDALLVQGERQVRSSIGAMGIIDQAKASTGLFVRNFLQRLGYEQIEITFDDSQKPLLP